VPALLCAGIVLGGAGVAGATAILDPNQAPAGASSLSFLEFNSVATGTVLSTGDPNSPNQQFSDDGIVFSGVVVGASTPYFSKHIGGVNNTVVIQFPVPVFFFATSVQSGVPDPNQPDIGLTFRAHFENGGVETHQFPLDNDPTLPNTSVNGPPFSFGTTQFVGFFENSPTDRIEMIEFFQSPIGDSGTLLSNNLPTFPRIGNQTLVQVVPEPATLVLLGLAFGGLAALRRRTRH
jgi:hypothetical protein